jgi:pilus assembly protein Flp/PilA
MCIRIMQALLRRLRKDGSAQAMVEYGLIIGLVALVVAGAVFALSGGLKGIFGNVTNCLNTPTSTCATGTSSSSSTTGG